METASQSEDREIAEDLLRFFVEEGQKECFAACLFTCYDLIKPDVAVEVGGGGGGGLAQGLGAALASWPGCWLGEGRAGRTAATPPNKNKGRAGKGLALGAGLGLS